MSVLRGLFVLFPVVLFCSLGSATQDISNMLKEVYNSQGDFLYNPESIRYFAKYRCVEDEYPSYNMSIPGELTLYFSFEGTPDHDVVELLPDNDQTTDSLDEINLNNMKRALDAAIESDDPLIGKMEKLDEAIQKHIQAHGHSPIMKSLQFSILTRQILNQYGYQEMSRYMEVEAQNEAIEEHLVLKGNVEFNFSGKFFQEDIDLVSADTYDFHRKDLVDGWKLSQEYAIDRGYPSPPDIPNDGLLIRMFGQVYGSESVFSTNLQKYNRQGFLRSMSIRNSFRIPKYSGLPPDSFKGSLYLGYFENNFMTTDEIKSHRNAPIPASANLHCEKEFDEELENEVAAQKWLATNGFVLKDYNAGKYDFSPGPKASPESRKASAEAVDLGMNRLVQRGVLLLNSLQKNWTWSHVLQLAKNFPLDSSDLNTPTSISVNLVPEFPLPSKILSNPPNDHVGDELRRSAIGNLALYYALLNSNPQLIENSIETHNQISEISDDSADLLGVLALATGYGGSSWALARLSSIVGSKAAALTRRASGAIKTTILGGGAIATSGLAVATTDAKTDYRVLIHEFAKATEFSKALDVFLKNPLMASALPDMAMRFYSLDSQEELWGRLTNRARKTR